MSKQPVSPQVITKLLSYDYKNAFEKISFTVLGILIALWINHCDENRKKNKVEMESLQEIVAALNSDLEDIKSTLDFVGPDISAVSTVIDVVKGDIPATDSLPFQFAKSFAYSFFLPNTAAYETLKSRGMETITNDSIRLSIAQLYDVTYEYQHHVDDRQNQFYMNFVAPYFVNYFQRDQPGGPLNPLDLNNLQKNPQFLAAMMLQRDNYFRVKREYLQLQDQITHLKTMIGRELEDLK